MDKLFEGLKENDLESLVLKTISIDEYESKLDDDSIVIAFYVQDRDPAQDLNRFIQKGATELLDTDVSPAPNEDGNFVVFVEIIRDENTPQKILEILGTLYGLTGNKEWLGQFYGHEEELPVTLENLQTLVRLQSNEDSELQDVVEFFKESDLDDLKVSEGIITLKGLLSEVNLKVVDFGDFDTIKERNAVMSQGYRLDEAAQNNVSRVSALLGDHWLVEHLQSHLLLSRVGSDNVLLVRL